MKIERFTIYYSNHRSNLRNASIWILLGLQLLITILLAQPVSAGV